MRIMIKSTNVRQEVTSKGNTLHKQQCALDQGGEFPLPFYVTIPADKPYPVGMYDIHPSAFRVNRFGSLEIDPYNFHLVALADGKAASRAA